MNDGADEVDVEDGVEVDQVEDDGQSQKASTTNSGHPYRLKRRSDWGQISILLEDGKKHPGSLSQSTASWLLRGHKNSQMGKSSDREASDTWGGRALQVEGDSCRGRQFAVYNVVTVYLLIIFDQKVEPELEAFRTFLPTESSSLLCHL